MAFVGVSDDFDLDENGILRDSLSREVLITDDDGIVQDDDLDLYRHVIQGHWTDSGIGGDKQSSTSTLHHRQNSFEEDLPPLGDESINISELEASKEDVSFDRPIEKYDRIEPSERNTSSYLDVLDSRESTLDKPVSYKNELSFKQDQKQTVSPFSDFDKRQLFSEDYFRQLHDLGVLVDGVDLSRDSLTEFDEAESHVPSQLDDEAEGKLRDSQDLIGEYLESELRIEEEENAGARKDEEREIGRRGSDLRESELRDYYSQTSSRTISSYSFPEDGVDYDKNNISENLGHESHSHAQNVRVGEDEYYYISGRILPASPGEIAGREQTMQPQKRSHGSRAGSRAGTPVGQNTGLRSATVQSLADMPNPGPVSQRRTEEDARSVHSETIYAGSRPSSRTSHVSTASDRQKKVEEVGTKQLAKTNSQESFFEEGQHSVLSGERTHQKRLLPKPSSSEPSHSFKIKYNNAGNFGNRQGPVKTSHVSDAKASRVSRVGYEGDAVTGEKTYSNLSGYIDESAKELSDRLTQEAQKRKQATELVQQLQEDYGNLLTKYALAELTIDQMRVGAKITLHADSPTPSQAQSGVMSPALSQQAQVISLQQSPSHGILMTSPAQAMMGHISPFTDDHTDGRSQPVSGDQRSRSRLDFHRGSMVSLLQSVADSDDGIQKVSETRVATVKADLMVQVKNMEDRLESFCALLDGGQLNLESQEDMFEQIKGDHDTLRRAYLQVKDEYNVLRRSGALAIDLQNFDHNKELEGHLFRLGMRFDEVHERVEINLKERPKQRRPFQPNNNKADDEKRKGQGTKNRNDFTDNYGGSSGSVIQQTSYNGEQTDSVESSEASKFEQLVQQLRVEYNSNMDLYRKLKYSSNTPEGERQIEHIVMKLNDICTEMPDMFRLSPEIQARRDQMLRENRLIINDRKNSVWEKLNQKEQEMKQQRRSPVSQLLRGGHSSVPHSPLDERAPIILRQGSSNSEQDSLRARLDSSGRSSLNSILPDRMDRPSSQSNSMTDQSPTHNSTDRPSSRSSNRGYLSVDPDRPPSRSRTPGGDNSFSDSMSRAQDTSSTSLPRPRRHEHGMRDPKFSEMPDVSGVRNLPRNTTSDHQNHGGGPVIRGHHQNSRVSGADGATGPQDSFDNMEGALAALPGPGKLKQMSKQRASDDADSGFIGSVVGSGVGLHPGQLQEQQQQLQQQLTLKLTTAADESSTLTDQSLDTSGQAVERLRIQHKGDKAEITEQQKSRGHSSDGRKEESYDAEEETMETLESDVSLRREDAVRQKSRSQDRESDEGSNRSRDATLEESYSQESEVSTPRAASQSPSKPVIKEKVGSVQATANHQARGKSQKYSSQAQTVSETEDELISINAAKAQKNRAENLHTPERQQSTTYRRLKSPPPTSRPPSRGSPTTDLFHSRERLASGGSRRSSGSSRGLTEVTRQTVQEQLQERGQIRQEQARPLHEHHISRQGKLAGLGSDVPVGLPVDPQSPEIARRVKEYEERSTGSDDVEVGSSVTRSSSIASSNRLKALQEEIERLKEGVAKANERANQPPLPAQIYHMPAPAEPSALQQRQEQEFYDPFDDPYGFMRMPRRRANSFSGGREREWDEWYWTLPQNRQYDGGDIPLGYAAADAYADLPMNESAPGELRNTRENVKNRLRQRRMERNRQRGDLQPGESVPGVDGTHLKASKQPHLAANQQQSGAGLPNEQTAAMYEYYVPSRYSASSMRQQMASQGYFTTPSGAKIYSSTGEEGDNEEERDVVSDAGFQANTAQTYSRPWYQIRRTSRPLPSHYANRGGLIQAGGYRRSQSQEDINHWNQTSQHYSQHSRHQANPAVNQRTSSQVCPMCGGTGSHTHTSHAQMSQPFSRVPPPQYSAHRDSSPARRSRKQSRSPGHTSEHLTYRVREYSRLSDSDEDERISRRSRSLSRGRSRNRSHGSSRDRRNRRRSGSLSDPSEDEETSLDHSLSLSVDIGRLTNKMLGTVSGELLRLKDKREFGSSIW